jgi:hypothetical protein
MWYTSFDHKIIKSNDICSYLIIDVWNFGTISGEVLNFDHHVEWRIIVLDLVWSCYCIKFISANVVPLWLGFAYVMIRGLWNVSSVDVNSA